MSSDENKILVRRYYEEIVNSGKVDKIEDFISPEYVEVYDGKRYAVGIEGARKHILGGHETYQDLQLKIEKQIAEDQWVVTCLTARGIHRGTWMGIKPTGKEVSFTVVNVDKVVDGRIVEHGGAANMLGPLLEIGAVQIVGP
jgi:predicted ester cyclase